MTFLTPLKLLGSQQFHIFVKYGFLETLSPKHILTTGWSFSTCSGKPLDFPRILLLMPRVPDIAKRNNLSIALQNPKVPRLSGPLNGMELLELVVRIKPHTLSSVPRCRLLPKSGWRSQLPQSSCIMNLQLVPAVEGGVTDGESLISHMRTLF